MKIKVCGMRDAENISELIKLKPDFIGFIFYNKSKRLVTDFPQIEFPEGIKKIGVFVNASINEVIEKVDLNNLEGVQLHGNETPEYCEQLKSKLNNQGRIENLNSSIGNYQIEIIKAFSVDKDFDFEDTLPYQKMCNYLLFDTKGKNYGGNGMKFNWDILKNYSGKIPFLLSGGITKKDVEEIKKMNHKAFIGIDINSGFEIKPGLKNITYIKEFKNKLK